MASTAKNITDLKSKSVEQLSKDVDALKTDIASLVETLKGLGAESKDAAVSEAKRQAANLGDEARTRIDTLQSTADQLAAQAKETVQEKPASALMIAAAIGMAFGFMTARK